MLSNFKKDDCSRNQLFLRKCLLFLQNTNIYRKIFTNINIEVEWYIQWTLYPFFKSY